MKQEKNSHLNFISRTSSILTTVALFFVTIFVFGVGFIWLLQMLGFNENTRGVLASIASILLFSLTLYNFNYKDIVGVFRVKWTMKITIYTLLATLSIIAVNYILSYVITIMGVEHTSEPISWQWLTIIGVIFLSPFVEELAFRVGLKQMLINNGKWSVKGYVLISSTMFALLHWEPGALNVIMITTTFIIGVILSITYIRTNSAISVMIIHMIYNSVIFYSLV